jgi:hypothetical protein
VIGFTVVFGKVLGRIYTSIATASPWSDIPNQSSPENKTQKVNTTTTKFAGKTN